MRDLAVVARRHGESPVGSPSFFTLKVGFAFDFRKFKECLEKKSPPAANAANFNFQGKNEAKATERQWTNNATRISSFVRCHYTEQQTRHCQLKWPIL
jgi:hypothetical protein